MKMEVNSLDNKKIKDIDLDKQIFGVELKEEIIYRMVRYQMAKRRSGNHKTKGISEISGTTKKPFKQKGTGSARQGSKRSPQMRGGAVIFGPQVRSHAHKLPKKIKDGKFKIISELKISKPKTNLFRSKLSSLKLESVLFIDGKDIDNNFLLAAKNVPKIDILPVAGINVYDILKRDFLVLSENAVNGIKERFEEWKLFLLKNCSR